MPLLETTERQAKHVGNGEPLFGQHTILKAKEKKGREDSGRRTGPADKSNAHNVPEKGRENSRPAHFSGPAYGTYTVPAFGRWPDGHLRQSFLFPLFPFKINYIAMRPKNNYILRFDSRELAKSCFYYFPVKAVYGDGFTIIISSASTAEWMIYQQVIGLLRERKINIIISNY